MHPVCRSIFALLVAFAAAAAFAQEYREDGWAKLPNGKKWGQTSAIDIDRQGNIWVFERCGANSCIGSNVAPLVKLSPSGKFLKSFGAGMFAFPHGIHVDKAGNVWVTDADGKDGKGHQVVKFSADGKVLLTLGKAGVAGDGLDTFNRPSDVTTAPNGDIFVADGHGGDSNARIVKFSKDGKFIKTWGKKGTAAGEFDSPHALAMDSKGRLFVGDRFNNRIQIFDQDGNFLEEWKQFGRPSGIFIDRNDVLYVADHQSGAKLNPGFKRGVRIGSVQGATVATLIPGLGPDPDTQSVGEGVAADAAGNVYWAETAGMTVRKFRK
ncbi:MAG TPA: peptidyl-alpha-hydroxyglycine alpha-amidating lyase family protein [Burkholderiales bacterium]|nr:peptidyl-alpha-hydroxyglycine alpha-amidating lyase family protein [Burkholderiales bacterium]